jgi:hypothetical protein
MPEAQQPLAIHVSQLTSDVMGELADKGYTIMRDASGWLLFEKSKSDPLAPKGDPIDETWDDST